MGVVTGFLGAAPSLIWASGAMFIVAAPLLVPLAIWIYTLVFAFASLWFAHYLLAALERLRAAAPVRTVSDAAPTMASQVQDVEDVSPKPLPGTTPSLPGPAQSPSP
jgi:1,4-dihydroxy-2-naphthoate octaprenyltransferase